MITFRTFIRAIASTLFAVALAGCWSGDINSLLPDSLKRRTSPPTVTISFATFYGGPAVESFALSISGTATGNAGVSKVWWSNSVGEVGEAVGSTHWSINAVPLRPGPNKITITACDLAGSTGTAEITLTYGDSLRLGSTTLAPQSKMPQSSPKVICVRQAGA